MDDYSDWRSLRELDEAAGCAKGAAFRAFKVALSTLSEGRDFVVLEPHPIARREELPKDKKILFVCAVGQRSALAAEMAAAAGLPADALYTLDGGTDAWKKAGQPVEA